jgi:hypothetical protein
MPAKNNEKDKEKDLIEERITPILVVGGKFKPYIELFENYPENILLKSLGTLTGFFKIDDLSEDSAYIVNFLTSILKKEYYANHKRTVSESFDAALKKVNLALSELAKQGNVNWIGKLNASICVLEKNNLHFTVCGNSKILLLRNQLFSDISRDLSDESLEPNPLKTFSDVSSGRLLAQDKLVITTDDIFRLFTVQQIKKNALRLGAEKFIQFMKTALINELKLAGTIIIDISEPPKEIESSIKIKKKREADMNAFSEKTFRQANSLNIKNMPPLNSDYSNDYVDKKTGHIYIQGESGTAKKEGEVHDYSERIKYALSDFFYNLKEKMKLSLARNFRKIKTSIRGKIKKEENPIQKTNEKKVPPIYRKENQPIPPLEKENAVAETNSIPEERLEKPKKGSYIKDSLFGAAGIWKNVLSKISAFLKAFGSKLIPNFSKAGFYFKKLSYQQKLYAFSIILLIFVVPYIYVKFQKKAEEKKAPAAVQSEEQATMEIISSEKNLKPLSVENISFIQNPIKLVLLNGRLFAVSKNQIISWDSNNVPKQSDFPSNFSSLKLAASMDDLNIIFLIDDQNRVFSFSPTNYSFADNAISIPQGSNLLEAGTYLTYLYLIDGSENKIYRYPRADGGFGSGVNWLKDGTDLKSAADIAMDDNIYLLENNQVIKLFKGKKIDFNLEPLANEANINALVTSNQDQNLYLLDDKYGRILKYAKNGALVAQYQDDKIKNAVSFTVDEQTSKLYFVSYDSNLFSANLD